MAPHSTSNKAQKLSFENTASAFAYKSDSQLKQARLLFAAMGNSVLLKVGLAVTPLAIKWHLPFTRTLLKKTIFKQFVGGETLSQTASVVNDLAKYNVQVILDYGVEGGDDNDAGYDHAKAEFIRVIQYAASQPNIPFISIKVTGIVRFSLLEKIDADMHASPKPALMQKYYEVVGNLDEKTKKEWDKAVLRLREICEEAKAANTAVLIDAEESWIQDPVDALAIMMMDHYNKSSVLVYNTIQLYRHDRLAFLKLSHEAAVERKFVLGAKLVRGAYMEKERKRAAELGYASPIQPTKAATDADYNAAVAYCLNNIDTIAVIIATHNEESNLLAAKEADQFSVDHHHNHLHFSQLYGMSDNITFNLAIANFSVSKYLPFGPVDDVVPYLLRRAQENSSVSGQTGRELGLIDRELKRRKTAK